MVEIIDDDKVVDPSKVIESVSKQTDVDQIAVFVMKNGKFGIWSSHCAEEMENMIDDALDALYEGSDDLLDPDDNEE